MTYLHYLSLAEAILPTMNIKFKCLTPFSKGNMQIQRLFLDDKDLKIIKILSKDCRESFMSIGSAIGMTSKICP
jgi:hypothetical protein